MTEPTDRAFVAWLLDGPETGPPEGLARALEQTRRTTQRPGWLVAERWLPMDQPMQRVLPSRGSTRAAATAVRNAEAAITRLASYSPVESRSRPEIHGAMPPPMAVATACDALA